MHREKYPEKVPFRLTRMLINAMEVSGIEGNFRFTCENVMTVLRENKESLMAVLEAFVYDPLINWRLLTPAKVDGGQKLPNDNADLTKSKKDNDESVAATPSSMTATAPVGAGGAGPALPHNADDAEGTGEQLNERAITVISRISNKLTGRDFNAEEELKVNTQVDLLIKQATNQEHLAQCYIGYCATW